MSAELRAVLEELIDYERHNCLCPAAEWSGTRPACDCDWDELEAAARAALASTSIDGVSGTGLEELRRLSEAATERRPIPGHDGYEADTDGNIYSLVPWRGQANRRLQSVDDGDGYLRVRLTIKGKRYNGAVHRLVCTTFHGPRPSIFHEVRHLNGDSYDNRAVNLAWGTRAENAGDRSLHGRTATGERNGAAKLTEDQVRDIRSREGQSQRALAREFGVDQATIGRIRRGEQWAVRAALAKDSPSRA